MCQLCCDLHFTLWWCQAPSPLYTSHLCPHWSGVCSDPLPTLNWVVNLLLSLYSDTALETGSTHTPYLRGSSCSLEALKHKCCQSPWSRFSQIFFDYFMSAVTVADPQLRRCACSLNLDTYVMCLNSLAGGYSVDPESILEITLSLQCWLCYVRPLPKSTDHIKVFLRVMNLSFYCIVVFVSLQASATLFWLL